MVHLLVGHPIQLALRARRVAGPGVEGAREVAVVAVAADDVGVERDELVLREAPVAGLLEPGVGPGSGGEEAGLDVVAAEGDHALVQDRPELVLAQPGSHRRAEPGDRDLGRADRGAHALQLLGGLDRAGALHRRLRVGEVEALVAERERRPRVGALDPDRRSRPALLADELGDLPGPGPLDGLDPGAGGGVAGGDRGADLVDRLEAFGEVRAAGELVQDHRPGLRDEQVARRVARVEDLHVARAGRVADVHRVEQDARVERVRLHLLAHAAQAVGPDRGEIDRLLHRELVERRQLGQIRPIGVPVEVHRRSLVAGISDYPADAAGVRLTPRRRRAARDRGAGGRARSSRGPPCSRWG